MLLLQPFFYFYRLEVWSRTPHRTKIFSPSPGKQIRLHGDYLLHSKGHPHSAIMSRKTIAMVIYAGELRIPAHGCHLILS